MYRRLAILTLSRSEQTTNLLHFLNSQGDVFQWQLSQRRSCSRRAPSKLANRQSKSGAGRLLSGMYSLIALIESHVGISSRGPYK